MLLGCIGMYITNPRRRYVNSTIAEPFLVAETRKDGRNKKMRIRVQ
jgi:hypothetical protein